MISHGEFFAHPKVRKLFDDFFISLGESAKRGNGVRDFMEGLSEKDLMLFTCALALLLKIGAFNHLYSDCIYLLKTKFKYDMSQTISPEELLNVPFPTKNSQTM